MKKVFVAVIAIFLISAPNSASAQGFLDPNLSAVYSWRADLQASFDKDSWEAVPDSAAGFLIDLKDWAEQYGWQEYPVELVAYKPDAAIIAAQTGFEAAPEVTAGSYIILDRHSGRILAEKHSTAKWPIASITKLMTAHTVLEQNVPMSSVQAIYASDDVGGAKLYVSDGARFTLQDLMYATLVASANNAANALSHSTPMSRDSFIASMNRTANMIGLPHTRFVDPTGIELGNVSTAREIARMADFVFGEDEIRRCTSTTYKSIHVLSDDTYKTLTTTNYLLYKPEFDDVYVMSGKTGYLDESKWNLVVSLRPELHNPERELLLVVFGAESRWDSARDTRRLADWIWRNYSWQPL